MAPQASASAPSHKQEIISLLFTVGVAAAALFVKNPAHQEKAANIISILQSLLPQIEQVL